MMVLTPVAVLVVLSFVGLGAADVFAPRAAADAKSALAPLCTFVALVIATPLLLVGVSPIVSALVVLVPLTGLTMMRLSRALFQSPSLPFAVAALAIALAAFPAIKKGTWAPATYGNQDPYVWVSQAHSLADGPPSGARRFAPDRIEYELIATEKWSTGLPGTLAELASFEGVDPIDAYGVFAALASALFTLAVFFCARACLELSRRRSTITAALVTANGFALLASFYGWQAQVLLTAVASVAVLTFPRAFDRDSTRKELVIPAAFGAATVGLYGWFAVPFIGMAVVAACVRLRARFTLVEPRELATRLAGSSLLFLCLGAVAMVRGAEVLVRTRGQESALALRYHDAYAWSFPSDALGLVPRSPRDIPSTAWGVIAVAAAAAVLVPASLRIWRERDQRRLAVLGACTASVLGLVAFGLTRSSPYLSVKLMGYSIPFFALLVAGAELPFSRHGTPRQAGAWARLLRAGVVTAVVGVGLLLFVTTTATTAWGGWSRMRYASATEAASNAVLRLPPSDLISVDVPDGWSQVWFVYRLRDRRIIVQQPSIAFTGYWTSDGGGYRPPTAAARYRLERDHGGAALWRGDGLALYSLA